MVSVYWATVKRASITHHPMLVISPFLTFQHVLVNIGNNGVCVKNAVVDIRNDGVGVQDSNVCIYR